MYFLRTPYANKIKGGSAAWSNNDVMPTEFFNPAIGPEINDDTRIKVWNGATYDLKPVKMWNGSSWITKPVKRWSGSNWVTIETPDPPPFYYNISNLQSNAFFAGVTTNVTLYNSFVPANSLLCVILYAIRNNSSTASARDGWSVTTSDGKVWTRRWHSDPDGTKTFGAVFSLWTTPITSAELLTVSLTTDASQQIQVSSNVFAITGPTNFSFGTPVTSTTLYSTSTTGIYLPAVPSRNSFVLASRVYNDNGSFVILGTPGGPVYKELFDGISTSIGYGQIHTQYANYTGWNDADYRPTPTDYVYWDDFDSLDRGSGNIFYCRTAAIEIIGS